VLPVSISAKTGFGIDELLMVIRIRLGVDCFDLAQPVCFNTRQLGLLEKISKTDSKSLVACGITELLNGPAAV
jgi:hypothetical protein